MKYNGLIFQIPIKRRWIPLAVMMVIAFSFNLSPAQMISFKTRLYDTDGTVDILVFNPRKEPVALPQPYYPQTLTEIYGANFKKAQLLEKQFSKTRIMATGSNITMTVTYSDDANEGFNDPTLGNDRKTAFEFGLSQWSSRLQGPGAISIVATMSPRGGTASSAVLASCGPGEYSANFTNAPRNNTWYCDALADIISGTDLHPDLQEISVDFNSDVDNSSVLGDRGFYYGTDGNPGSNYDFVGITMHEMGHGLGLISSFRDTGRWGWWGEDYFYPTIYDRFLTNRDGSYLITLDYDSSNVVGGNVFWDGLIGKYSCQHEFSSELTKVPLFAPDPWDDGSSITHLDESTFSGGSYELMTPSYSRVIHTPDSILLGILQDMGWSLSKSRYIKSSATGVEEGSSINPYNTITEGLDAVPENGYLRFFPGNYGAVTITGRNLHLRSCGGSAVLGAAK